MSYKTEAEAKAAGEKLLARMKGKDWRLRVWENLGWHISVINWPVAVYEFDYDGEISYHTSMSDVPCKDVAGTPLYLCPDDEDRYFSDPNKAIEAQLKFARKFVSRVFSAVSRGEEIMGMVNG